jgi:hypothetical protein
MNGVVSHLRLDIFGIRPRKRSPSPPAYTLAVSTKLAPAAKNSRIIRTAYDHVMMVMHHQPLTTEREVYLLKFNGIRKCH